ncbi:MAG: DUF3524 domain-containing protein [Roseiflexaceae bacterium]
MHIVWLDPFHGGSHAAVANGFASRSRWRVSFVTLSQAGGWRWRMRGAAISMARQIRANRDLHDADLLITTDMLDLATFLGLTRDLFPRTPTLLYMHENQLTYPLPPGRQRDLSLPWINYTASVAADRICFNSAFHRDLFLRELVGLPGRFHDHQELDLIKTIQAKSQVLYPGVDLDWLSTIPAQPANDPPIILWNSRWEYDKNPQAFFRALQQLEQRGIDFRVIVAGEHIDPNEATFRAAREHLAPRTVWWGYAPDLQAYRRLLRQADLVVSCAVQEFFGIAVIEAMAAGCVPVLPQRLSYPELIPSELHAECFYHDDNDLADRLAESIRELPHLRTLGFSTIAQQYGWQHQINTYDSVCADLV